MDNHEMPESLAEERDSKFYVEGKLHILRHLDDAMDFAFMKLYSAHLGSSDYNLSEFDREALTFFDRNQCKWGLHDNFFTNFTGIANSFISKGQYDLAKSIWLNSLELAHRWENLNNGKRLHKGTPFYWLGFISIEERNLDEGYLYMHRAVQEDKQSNEPEYKAAPPFLLVSLDFENPRQAALQWTMQNSQFLGELLRDYQAVNSSKLTLKDFRLRFLQSPPDDETLFLFSYTLGRLYHLNQFKDDELMTQFAGQIELSLLFNPTIVIDETIVQRYTTAGRARDPQFAELIGYLSKSAGLKLTQNEYSEIKNDPTPYDKKLQGLVDGSFSTSKGITLTGLERDLALTYVIRNHAAHNAARESPLWSNFVRLRQSLFNTLFLAVDCLHK